jgi:hypothetical protein
MYFADGYLFSVERTLIAGQGHLRSIEFHMDPAIDIRRKQSCQSPCSAPFGNLVQERWNKQNQNVNAPALHTFGW